MGVSYSFVDINDNDTVYFDLYLMSECKHQILSNSSFSFWSGYLCKNEKKMVIIPDKWTNAGKRTIDSDIANRAPGWIVLPHDGGTSR